MAPRAYRVRERLYSKRDAPVHSHHKRHFDLGLDDRCMVAIAHDTSHLREGHAKAAPEQEQCHVARKRDVSASVLSINLAHGNVELTCDTLDE